jgi:hypothetical protein
MYGVQSQTHTATPRPRRRSWPSGSAESALASLSIWPRWAGCSAGVLAADTPPGFDLHILDGSVLWVAEGGVVAELVPESEDAALTGVIHRRVTTS